MKLTQRMRDVIKVLREHDGPMTPNNIGRSLGFNTGHREKGPQSNHCGRVMGPAQRVIFSLTALRRHGLVIMTRRPDGLSGTAYELSFKGRQV